MLRTLDLFSGIGGFSLGLERTGGFETIAFCEIDPFCRKVLAKHWPGVPIHADATILSGADIGPVDVVVGGPPCQRTSVAAAIHGGRTGDTLARGVVRLAVECRAKHVVIEQPAGNAQWERTVQDMLAAAGFDSTRYVVAAGDCGAPHKRRRVFIFANRDGAGLAVAGRSLPSAVDSVARAAAARGDWSADSARNVRVADGVPGGPYRRQRIMALGNSLPPTLAEAVGRAMLAADHHLAPPPAAPAGTPGDLGLVPVKPADQNGHETICANSHAVITP